MEQHIDLPNAAPATRFTIRQGMIPVQRPDVLAQGVLEEMVLYDGETEMGYSLNASAKAIWDSIDGSKTVQQICTDLSTLFEIPPDELVEDVHLALRQLMTLGLVREK